ncbi:MAG: bifunctional (p)ppGpp synthetase/guanosine-3',5'-bis(diphosphate) 3'-pyrophosphohydrolase [Tabrizicola sp.]|uniref:RelA/SpoT family protein n=1 Tax=Tabrizicola sp. TaxID=2005166 RepID=UPI0027353F79|nr:bifunctional (p)ppGpp synthetase/guanosine-3',5'-bis(diphosphate) 3'-pyrophosphohydrolase [Tabrizicola sp.]MDP3263122.1 bifunctional (p)ppGpp synthetase/guanosine-3',5'-bis(diphosphate) 3'-pyrophosphohydrolase [Tabrizicola sp.]MDP3649829.1 bifunctional (p)ppGpp synthetase/guanosine-3',5'-bis(diphosphate) 3'-pyrophosphohydrolase [Paracoccaceae bacterium]MDZ4067207.1 bifunctional (p)ppGpp synthetase/guanosine-3',5'-bis(diphosphate) 3'-pyrophosphohydrolase [Tabrizicola sp.]
MIDVEDLIALVRNYNPRCNADQIRKAYAYGFKMHDGQMRKSGEPYFTHPVAVAAILTEQRLDDATIITALLHDTIEDTRSTYTEITALFGEEVAELVDGVTKLTNLQLSSTENQQAENFRKLFMAMSKDLRVILVKLGDRLHNMRTIKSMKPEKQAQKARETMEIFAPLAGRMGMQWMREELEDLSFKVLNPEARNSIIRRFLTLQREAGDVVHKITGDIRHELEKAQIEADVFGRAKKPYSIWRKMQEKDLAFSRLSDIYGFRVICGSVADCYRILGVIHQRWRAVPGRFKDYISQPKNNGYRSIHTTVSGRDGKRVEVQIRTREMHEVAEAGVAAHWSYREGVRARNPFAVDPAKWIAALTERLDAGDTDEFLENVKLEMYSDQVFCFTPKGDVIQLPRGATPLDYAYAIHTRIGNSCVSAKIDGIRVPLWTRLKNGQSVEIITAEGQRPQSSWIDIVTTGRAKAAIRRSLREEDRGRFVKLGQELARAAFDHVGKKATDKALRTAAKMLGLTDENDLLARLGSAELTARRVVETLYPDLAQATSEEVDAKRPVVGLTADQTFKRAQCCQPVPGERIVGITYRGQGVVVHAIDCPALEEFEDQTARWVDLQWHSGRHAPVYTITLEITISNDAGVLGRICTLIGEQKANISDLRFTDRKPDFYRLVIDVDLRDVEHLHMVMTALEAETDVAQISRHRDLTRRP